MLRPSVQALYCHIHLQQLVVGFHVQLRLLNNELASDLMFLMKPARSSESPTSESNSSWSICPSTAHTGPLLILHGDLQAFINRKGADISTHYQTNQLATITTFLCFLCRGGFAPVRGQDPAPLGTNYRLFGEVFIMHMQAQSNIAPGVDPGGQRRGYVRTFAPTCAPFWQNGDQTSKNRGAEDEEEQLICLQGLGSEKK